MKENFAQISLQTMKHEVIKQLEKQQKEEPVALIPENFHAEDYYRALPIMQKDAKRVRDSFHFILSAVTQGTLIPNFDFTTHFQVPQPLSSALLKKVLGNDYGAYVSTLVNNDVIDVVQLHKWKSARHYILGQRYRNQPLKHHRYQHPVIRRCIRRTKKEHLQSLKKDFRAYAPLIYWLWDDRFQIDEPAAKDFYQHFLNHLLKHAKQTSK